MPSGVYQTYYKIWRQGEEEPKEWTAGTELQVDIGTWNLKYYSVDNAGNEEEPVLRTFTVTPADSVPCLLSKLNISYNILPGN